ncbi:MAG: 16S rRNA (guanine(966)-N(2))-methyltransferase RsmD [Verrucomicrobiota bacterium]
MRVIAGAAGGIRLEVPKSEVRPTMDRVKAAIFSSLGDLVVGARVLDLFAGTGALGIEALSRGAASALFVEENSAALTAIERNLSRTKMDGRLCRQDVFAFLGVATGRDPFTIIFADPPYEKTKSGAAFTDLLISDARLPHLLDPAGVFVLEKFPGETMPSLARWNVTRAKTYGATEVLFLRRADVSVQVPTA